MDQRPTPVAEIPVALVRDYQRINRELIVALDAGQRRLRLTGAEGQRLLVSGLAGPWEAVIEVDGDAGPELAADLDAPGLTVLCSGKAADGAGRGLKAGRLAIRLDAGDAVGAAMSGGSIVVAGRTGHRAGLGQRGGTLVLLGAVGRLAADRRRGGFVLADPARLEPPAGRPRGDGPGIIPLPHDAGPIAAMPPGAADALLAALDDLPDAYAGQRFPD